MSRSTGPILASAGVTLANLLIFEPGGETRGPTDYYEVGHVIVGTGIAAAMLAILERATPDLAVGLAWAAFATMMLARVNNRPSPTERILDWWTGI